MSSNLNEILKKDTQDDKIPEKYGILVDTDRLSIVVLQFQNHQELLNIILSDAYTNLILYRTQYHLPTDDELEMLTESIFSEES